MAMVDLESDVAIVAGAVIAGLVGLLAARYERRLVRRERHLEEHKENLGVVAQSLQDLLLRLWPPLSNPENFQPSEGLTPDLKAMWDGYSITDYRRIIGQEHGYQVLFIDDTLFRDIARHFPGLHAQLAAVDGMARTEGPKLNGLMYGLLDAIFAALRTRTIPPLYPGSEPFNTSMLAAVTFHLLVGTDTKEWASRYSQLKASPALAEVEGVVKQLKQSFGYHIDETVAARNRVLGEVQNCLNAIADIRHRQGLRGRCAYL